MQPLLQGLERELERRFMCVSGLPMALSQTGEAYIAFTHNGKQNEGRAESNHPCFSPEQAIISLAMHIAEYAAPRSGVLYWRVNPEVVQSDATWGWAAYARLLISDAPVRWRTYAQYEQEMNKEPA
jgi:hypothetical protein